MVRFVRSVATLTVLVALAVTARADVIFSNLGAGNSYDDFGWYVSGPDSIDETQYIAASFTPQQSYTLSSIDVPFYRYSGTATAVFRIVADQGGLPGSTVLGTATLSSISGQPKIYNVSFVSQSITLTALQKYWITALPGGFDTDLAWKTNNQGQNGYAGSFGDGWSTDSRVSPAFRVNGTLSSNVTVPEPATPLLMLLPLLSIGIVVRRRR